MALQGLEAVGASVGVDADTFAVAMINGDEDVRTPFGHGDGLGHVGAPHHVHGLGGDGAVMLLTRPCAPTVRGEQTMGAHQTPGACGRGSDARQAQPCPGLAIALAGEPRPVDRSLDMHDQGGVIAGADGAGPAFGHRRRVAPAIERRPGNLPAAGNESQAIGPPHGGRVRLAHRLDRRRAKGEPPSRRLIFSYSSSFSIIISPTLPCRRRISPSRWSGFAPCAPFLECARPGHANPRAGQPQARARSQ